MLNISFTNSDSIENRLDDHNDLYSAAQTVLTGWVHTLTHLEGGHWS